MLMWDSRMLEYPSFYGHAINGIIIFVSIILIGQNYNMLFQDPNQYIILLLLLAIAIGIHSISHNMYEVRIVKENNK